MLHQLRSFFRTARHAWYVQLWSSNQADTHHRHQLPGRGGKHSRQSAGSCLNSRLAIRVPRIARLTLQYGACMSWVGLTLPL